MQRRFFPDQQLDPRSELPQSEVERRSSYVSAVYESDTLLQLEIVTDGRIDRVIYDDTLPFSARYEAHHQAYPRVSFTIRGSVRPEGSFSVIEESHFAPEGNLTETTKYYVDGDNIVRAIYLDADGQQTRLDRFTYQENELIMVQVYDDLGKLIHEEQF